MNSQYNRTLALIRLFGVMAIFIGIISATLTATFFIAMLCNAPEWFSQSLAPYAVQGVVASPAYILGGILLFIFSQRIAKFVVKKCDKEEF